MYFMASTPNSFDAGYDPALQPYHTMLREIETRGHEVGFHPGYHTPSDPVLFGEQLERLSEALGRPPAGGRQHYLRFRVPDTWQIWADAGLEYDATLGYAEKPGFRCGTCHPFPVFNIACDRPLELTEIPLIAMDVTLRDYLGLSCREAESELLRLAEKCRAVGGTFSILVHNEFSDEWKTSLRNAISLMTAPETFSASMSEGPAPAAGSNSRPEQ
jgi:hypothetical protein